MLSRSSLAGLITAVEWTLVLDVSLKSTGLLLAAYLAHLLLGRRRALVRSALWNACLVGLLLLPLASLALPRLRVSIPAPAWQGKSGQAQTPAAPVPFPFTADQPAPEPLTTGPVPIPPFEASEPGPFLPEPVIVPAITPPPSRLDTPEPGSIGSVVVSLYLAGAAWLALRFALSLGAVWRLAHRGEPIQDPRWSTALARWRQELGIHRSVALRASAPLSVPVALGWLRPALIVPKKLVQSAGPELIDAIIVHELAHIRRGDYAWNLLLRLVRIVYWPQPLSWPLSRLISAAREQACDDLCIHALGGPARYRASLLEVASSLVRRPDPALGLAMARPARLAGRLAWIDRSRGAARCLLTRPARLGLLALVLGLSGTLGSLELAQAVQDPPPEAQEPSQDKPLTPVPPLPKGPPAIEITVLSAETGKPIEEARVSPRLDFETPILFTDREGIVRIDLSKRRFQYALSLDVWAPGHVQQRFSFTEGSPERPPTPAQLTVQLNPGEETLGGLVVDETGKPIPGVRVTVWGYLGERKDPRELAINVDTTTDADGRWRSRYFRQMTFAYVYLSHPDYLDADQFHPRRYGRPEPTLDKQPDEQPMESLRDFTSVEVMEPGIAVGGQVLDTQGKPVSGAEVGWIEAEWSETSHERLPRTTTGPDGRFHFPHARPGRLLLQVKAPGHAPALKPIDAKGAFEPVAITLDPPNTLRGRVVDTQGRPIPDAFVSVGSWRGIQSLGVYMMSDAEGRFQWTDAPADPFIISATRRDYLDFNDQSVSAGDAEVVLTLRRTLTISGRVRDDQSDARILQARVEVGTPGDEPDSFTWQEMPRVWVSSGRLQANLDAETHSAFRLRITALGYVPYESRLFQGDEAQVEYDVRLKPIDAPRVAVVGIVTRPDGAPLEGAQVAIAYPSGFDNRYRLPEIRINEGKILNLEGLTIDTTNAQGRFALSREAALSEKPFGVVVVHPNFFKEVDGDTLKENRTIRAEPWGRIEGTLFIGSERGSQEIVNYSAVRSSWSTTRWISSADAETTTDNEGRFAFNHVLPGEARVSRPFPESSPIRGSSSGSLVIAKPGETTQVQVGGRGRPVVARVEPPESFDPAEDPSVKPWFTITNRNPGLPVPREVLAGPRGSETEWFRTWSKSPAGFAYRQSLFNQSGVGLQPDGTLRAEDIPPGSYRLYLTFQSAPINQVSASPNRIASASVRFVVPEFPGHTDEPLDIGLLKPKNQPYPERGEKVPDFTLTTLDGKTVSLDDYRGKHLLLIFWQADDPWSRTQIPSMQAIHDLYGADDRFAMLSLSADAHVETLRAQLAATDMPWPQIFLGSQRDRLLEDFRVWELPNFTLIGPDGKLITQPYDGQTIITTVRNLLDPPDQP